MIPLRAISEALQTEVKWDGEAYTINIETGNAPADTTGLPEYSLSADKLTAAAGETVDLYINVKNMPEGMYVSGVSAAVKFDPTAFEFVDAALVNGDKAIEGALGASNPEFTMPGLMKAAFVTVNAETAAQADGAVMKLTFKSINGKEGSFSISDSYHTKLGHSTELYVDVVKSDDDKAKKSVTYKGNDLVINATPVVINAAGSTAEPTATPAATATPEATAEPTATPDATATPEATVEPTATPAA